MMAENKKRQRGGIYPLLCDQKGEIYYEIIVKTVIVVVMLLTVINFYTAFIEYQNVNYTCKRVVRAIELEGAVNANIDNIFNQLKEQYKLDDMTYEVSDVSYFDEGTKKIQLSGNFTVTVKHNYTMQVLNPLFAPPLCISIPMTADITGMSEVYWKP